MAKRGKKGITEVPVYIDHRSAMYSWVETCDSRRCTWYQNQMGIAQVAKYYGELENPEEIDTETLYTSYLFENNVPYKSDFTMRFGDP